MRTSRFAVVVGGCSAVLAAGFAAAPEPIVPLETPDAPDPATPSASPEPSLEAFDGPPVSNVRGVYQARITVEDGVVVGVDALQAGTSAAESVRVNSFAIPEFRARVLAAQTWDVGPVSGASFTSPAFLESLEGAFAQAGL